LSEAIGNAWRAVPQWARRAAGLLLFFAILLVPAWLDKAFRAEKELYLLLVFIGLLVLGGPLYRAFWRVLVAAGVREPRQRWERQPRWIKALPVVSIAALVILVAWQRGTQPSPTLVVLLAILWALYVVPPRVRQFVVPVTVLAIAIVYPMLYAQNWLFGESVPIFNSLPSIDTMVTMAVYTMMALGLNMVVGYAGLLDLGYVAFFAIGAYSAAWFASPHFSFPDVLTGQPSIDVNFGAVGVIPGIGGIHISIWLVLLIGAAITAVAGVLIGLPTLRLRGDYLAIVTLGFGEMVAQVARNGDKEGLGGYFNLTNGPPGINPIDPPGFGSWLHDTVGLPADFLTAQGWWTAGSGEVLGDFVDLMYWGALFLVLVTLFCSIRLRDSRLGRAWIAIREDETAAAAMGIPLMRTKTWSYASGAFFGGVAGAWFGSFQQGVFPDTFNFNVSVFILCMVILGGMGNVWGVIAGATFLAYLNTEGLANMGGWMNDNVLRCGGGAEAGQFFSDGCVDVPLVAFGLYGIIIVAVMLVRPYGLFPEARRKQEFEVGVHDEPLYDEREHGEHGAGAR
jgi:branched-chain amino acid transport system permease protein